MNLCEGGNKMFCKCHKIYFTSFKGIRLWFDDKLDNAPNEYSIIALFGEK